jgi:hypothetical protein
MATLARRLRDNLSGALLDYRKWRTIRLPASHVLGGWIAYLAEVSPNRREFPAIGRYRREVRH